jgi:hypothetical protein
VGRVCAGHGILRKGGRLTDTPAARLPRRERPVDVLPAQPPVRTALTRYADMAPGLNISRTRIRVRPCHSGAIRPEAALDTVVYPGDEKKERLAEGRSQSVG